MAAYVKSFVAVARFVHAVKVAQAAGSAVSAVPVEAMRRAYQQAMQQARVEQKFSAKPKAWLDWDAVQVARARAVRLYEAAGGEGDARLRRLCFDAALLTWLTSVPPDRVGVTRQLRLGVTLKPTPGGGFDLDLSTPDAHKTAAAFGPTVTAVPAPTCALLRAWLALDGLPSAATASQPPQQQPYVFVPPPASSASSSTSAASSSSSSSDATSGHAAPVTAKRWTKVVQAAFKRHAGVALCPKDLRSSYITWLRSEANTDAMLKSAAFAMRHSTVQQAGPAYDKERSSRLSSAAVQQAQAHAAGF